jgi:rifampicin phosphotransferase
MTYIVRFTDRSADNHDLVGGKAANLERLTGAGFDVPPGFTISTQAYAEFMSGSGLDSQLTQILSDIDYADTAGVERQTAKLRELIMSSEIPVAIAAAVGNAYQELASAPNAAAPCVTAVRSSGTAEDLVDASFAGMHDTFLDVHGVDAVLDAVKRCWSSLWTARATRYRHDRGFAHEDVRLAVVVQTMVEAEVAGVMFTANPITAAVDELVINASWGLGESVVSGIVTPDEFIVNRTSLAVKRRTLGSKTVRVVRDPVSGQGAVQENVPASEQGKYTLTDRQVAELSRLGLRVMAHYDGFPQDIEWALVNDRFYLLQARPVTGVAFSWDEDLEYWQFQAETDDYVYTRAWADEYWNGPVSPLHYSYRAKELSDCHYTAQTLYGQGDVANMRTWKYYKGEAYFASNMERAWVTRSLPPNLRNPGSLNKLPPSWWPAVHEEPFSWLKYAWMLVRVKVINDRSAPFKFFAVFNDRIENRRLEANGVPDAALRKLSDEALQEHILQRLEIFKQADDDLWGAFFMYAPFALGLLGDLLGRWYDGDAAWAFADLCSGLPEQTVTLKENHELWSFGERLRASPRLRELLDEHTGAAFFAELENHAEGRAFLADYQPWLASRAHRGHADRDSWFPRRGDDPNIDYNAFKALMSASASVDPLIMEDSLRSKRRAREAEVHASIGRGPLGPFKLKLFKLVHAYSLAFLTFRDNEREYLDHLSYTQRRCFLELGRRMHERDLLKAMQDVWFLGVAENFAVMDGRANLALAHAKIKGRKENFMRFHRREANLPNYLLPNATPALPGEQIGTPAIVDESSELLPGAGTSQGVVSGRARVIKNLDEIGSLVPGDILVCNSTDPGWTPAFLVISGLVLETGGMLSHGACLSREYGLPAVAVPAAMSRIEDGSVITVDGTQGFVRLESSA